MRQMMKWNDYMNQLLKDDKEAEMFLKISLEEHEKDGDMNAFLLAIRTLIDARGSITDIAKKTHITRQHLYKTLSKKGNPTLYTLSQILSALNFRLSVERLKPLHAS